MLLMLNIFSTFAILVFGEVFLMVLRFSLMMLLLIYFRKCCSWMWVIFWMTLFGISICLMILWIWLSVLMLSFLVVIFWSMHLVPHFQWQVFYCLVIAPWPMRGILWSGCRILFGSLLVHLRWRLFCGLCVIKSYLFEKCFFIGIHWASIQGLQKGFWFLHGPWYDGFWGTC